MVGSTALTLQASQLFFHTLLRKRTRTSPNPVITPPAMSSSDYDSDCDSIFSGDDTQTRNQVQTQAPPLNASSEAENYNEVNVLEEGHDEIKTSGEDDDEINALGEEIFDESFWVEEETQEKNNAAVTPHHHGIAVPHPSSNDNMGDMEELESLFGDNDYEDDKNAANGEQQLEASRKDSPITVEMDSEPKLSVSSQENNTAAPSQTEATTEPEQPAGEFNEEWDAFQAGMDLETYRTTKRAAALSAAPKATNENPPSITSTEKGDAVPVPELSIALSNEPIVGDDSDLYGDVIHETMVEPMNETQPKVPSDDLKDAPATESANDQIGEDVFGDVQGNSQVEPADTSFMNGIDMNMTLDSYSSANNFVNTPALAVPMSYPEEPAYDGVQDDPTNGPEKLNFGDTMQVDLPDPLTINNNSNVNFTNGFQGQDFADFPVSTDRFGNYVFNDINTPVVAQNFTSGLGFGNDQTRPKFEGTTSSSDISGSFSPNTNPNTQADLPNMSSRIRSKVVKTFLRIYEFSQGKELEDIDRRVRECQKRIDVRIASASSGFGTSLPSAMAATGVSSVTHQSRQSQPYQMQNDTSAAQGLVYNNQMPMQSSQMGYGYNSSVNNGLVSSVASSSGMTFGAGSGQMAGGMNMMNRFSPALNFGGLQPQGSSGVVPASGFNPSNLFQQGQVPTAGNVNWSTPNNHQFNMHGSSSNNFIQATDQPSSYAPLALHNGSEFMQRSLQDHIQQMNLQYNNATAHYPFYANNPINTNLPSTQPAQRKRRRQYSASGETGRPRFRRRTDANTSVGVLPQTHEEFVDSFFVLPENDETPVICNYTCPALGLICNQTSRSYGRDGARNRYRHLATHAEAEIKFVERGKLLKENAVLFGRLRRVVVTCAYCAFLKEVWRTDGVREEHEKEAHPAVYERRQEQRRRRRKEEYDEGWDYDEGWNY